MKKYLCEVPIRYINKSSVDRYDNGMQFLIKIEETQLDKWNLTITQEKINFNSTETCIISIYTENENLYLKFQSIYADNEKYAIEIIEESLKFILPTLSYVVQLQNSNKHLFQFKLTYDVREITVKESVYEKHRDFLQQKAMEKDDNETVLRLGDQLIFKEDVNSKLIQTLNLDKYRMVSKVQSNTFIKQLLESYIRALGDTDYISKYFNLFIIVEALEKFYKEDVSTILLKEEQIRNLMVPIRDNLILDDKKVKNNIENRIKSTLKTMTSESRKVKLLKILNEILDIKKIHIFDNEKVIDENFVSTIIEQRNSLFHAKNIESNEYKELKNLVFELIILCEKVIFVLIGREISNLSS